VPEINTYGLRLKPNVLDAANAQLLIELECFKSGRTHEQGGLGKYAHFRNVCKFLWPNLQWHPWMEWSCRSLCENETNAFAGCATASKTYMAGVFAMAFWAADPKHTSVVLTTTTGKMVRRRIWPIIQQLYDEQPQFPGNMVDSKTTLQAVKGDDKNGIFGIAVGDGPVEKAVANIKGVHNKRMLVVIDEATDTPEAIFRALPNLQKGCEDFRLLIIGNPTSHMDCHGRLCEPKDGWNSISVEDEEWDIRGVPEWGIDSGVCLHFDGEKSPNVKLGEDKWKFIYTNRDLAKVQAQPGARETVPYWRETRGFWTPDGICRTIFSEALIQKYNGTGKLTFFSSAIPISALDPAFGGDKCILRFALLGDLPDGRTAIQLTESINIQIKATSKDPIHYQIAYKVIEECKKRGIEPKNFAMDTTGEGGGTADIICKEWNDGKQNVEIHRVEFGGAPSTMPVSRVDATPAKDRYDRKVTELYYSCRNFLMGGQLGGLNKDECIQFCSREYSDENKKIKLDTKKECRKKIGRSPDDADSAVVLIDLARSKGAVAGTKVPIAGNGSWKEFARKANQVYANVTYGDA